ncbi:MAG: ribosome biogenesis GTPase Der [Phycisphaerales bacterium]
MPIPRIAIVGRPNVGKSSLLNMMAGAKVAIVDATPGTTRDRVSVVVELQSPDGQGPVRLVEAVDTGGYGAYVAEGARFNEVGADLATLAGDIEKQIAEAVKSADLILFCIDTQAGVTPLDRQVAKLLREGKLGGAQGHTGEGAKRRPGKTAKKPKSAKAGDGSGDNGVHPEPTEPPAHRPPIRIVATKTDGPKWESHTYELSSLGFGDPLMVSAKSNFFRRDFLDGVYSLLPPIADEPPEARADLKLAIIGKRNAGKSSLVNALAGEERVIVSEIAGTTRDAVDVRLELDGKSILAIDTAGLRRKKSFANQIEWFAFDRAKRAIDRADVVALLLDATEPTSQVDEQLAMLVQKAYKPCVLVVNKWDLAKGQRTDKGRAVSTGDFEKYLRKELKGLDFAPIAFVSASTGLNLKGMIGLAFDLKSQGEQRVGTGKLNRMIEAILERHNPPSKLGTLAKCYYVAQVAVSPPTIVLVVNKPELFTANYQRFLLNRFREELPCGEVPIKLLIRARKRTLMKKGLGGWDPKDETGLTADEIKDVEKDALAPATGEPDNAEMFFEDE